MDLPHNYARLMLMLSIIQQKGVAMLTTHVQAVVLAAGKSSRLKSGHNKMLEKICGQEMILFPIKMLESLALETTVVVGFEKERITACIEAMNPQHVTFVQQQSPAGTGDAVRCTADAWHKEHILILNGDMPLVTTDIIENLYTQHVATDAAISFVIAHNSEPSTSYGRIIQKDGQIKIVEAREFTGDVHEHCCINAGIYMVKRDFLQTHIKNLTANQASNEFHITDLVALASEQQQVVTTTIAPFDYVRGINNQHELWAAEQIQRSNLIKYWMEHGVRFSVAQNVHIDLDVSIGVGSYIGCGAHLLRGTTIGNYCTIDEYVSVDRCTIGDYTRIYPMSVLKDVKIGSHVAVGPFAHIHDACVLEDNVVVGNFVEIKQTTIGAGTKAKHLTYLGDATIGNNVNIGAGTITCNFDGTSKHRTVIAPNAFIGSNNTLVAPVTIEQGAFTAAGSTITEDVPADALAIGRARQINKPLYAQRLRDRAQTGATHEPKTYSGPGSDTHNQTFTGAIRTVHDTIMYDDQQ
jgi:bifunctional UDP-N-acetylglucosamine pyrophosphorylase/glucosamine-1-phosphate N-acetyltransferase